MRIPTTRVICLLIFAAFGTVFKVFDLSGTYKTENETLVEIERGQGNAAETKNVSELSMDSSVTKLGNLTDPCTGNAVTYFDPYTLEGKPAQAYKKDLPLYEESCLPLKFSTHRKFPDIALASHPGSGNTWSRHLIQQLTGKISVIFYTLFHSPNCSYAMELSS